MRAVVHVRLLGLRLLSLDARVLVGPAAGASDTGSAEGALYPVERVNGARTQTAVGERALDPALRTAGLAEASELLEQSAASLARTRRASVHTS